MATPANEPYASEPLLEKVDSIRLVTVEPELSENGLTSCQLKTTAFARRPKYEALSYRWGDESTKKPILVNGIEMAVTTNLWAALQHFRTNPRGTPVWIDAVSINQSDVAERTRQIQIMPHIYTRASSVVVWLGEEFANVEQNLNVDKAEMATDSDLYERVIADEYWKRVWIRQEIGKGRQVQLLLGSDPVDWERFMHWLSLHNSEITPEGKAKAGSSAQRTLHESPSYSDGDSDSDWDGSVSDEEQSTAAGQGDKVGAAVLDHLRSGKYDGSCTLKSLITNHAEAHAKDPRDKIYGLVGLSSDGRGFPMDYKKSLYQVWVDTVRFMSAKKLLPKGPVHRVKFLRTVRAMLNLEETVSDVVDLHYTPATHCPLAVEDDIPHRDIKKALVKAQGVSLGAIISLGPSASELVASVELSDKWDGEVQRLYKDDLERATKENDDLMERILDSQDSDMVQLTSWEHYRADFSGFEHHEDCWDWCYPGTRPALEGAWNHELTTPNEARLAMITAGKTSCDFTPYKFAFVSPQARQGDFVCRLYGYPVKDVLVRAEEGETDSFRRSTETSFHVCGTAVMATEKDPTPNINHEEGRMFTDGSGLQEVVYEFPLRDTFHVKMDATTMYAVIFGNETREEKLRKILEDFRLSNGE